MTYKHSDIIELIRGNTIPDKSTNYIATGQCRLAGQCMECRECMAVRAVVISHTQISHGFPLMQYIYIVVENESMHKQQ